MSSRRAGDWGKRTERKKAGTTVELKDAVVVPIRADQAWQRVSDVPFVASCLPGLVAESLVQEDQRVFRARMVNSVMGVDANWDLRATFEPQHERNRLRVTLQGTDSRLHMSLNGEAEVLVVPADAGSSKLDYDANVRVDGSLAAMGGPVIKSIMSDTLARFVARVGGHEEDSASWWRRVLSKISGRLQALIKSLQRP